MTKVLVYLRIPEHLIGNRNVWQVGRAPLPSDEIPLEEYLVQNLPAAAREKVELVIAENDEQVLREIGDAEVFFGWMTPERLHAARRLRWVQNTNGSQENHLFPELIDSNITLTNQAGIYDHTIADHVYALILAFSREIGTFVRAQERRYWPEKSELGVFGVKGKILGVIGLGGIGNELARRAPAFKMRVVATRAHPEAPKPEYVEQVWGPDGLGNLLQQSDFVVNCTPETPSTRKLIGSRELALMKPTSYIFNVGRGSAIDLVALTKALQEGVIAGAGLDCFELEPLPADHSLWDLKNVLMTPHMASLPTPWCARVDVFLENLSRYLEGKPLINVVDKKSGH